MPDHIQQIILPARVTPEQARAAAFAVASHARDAAEARRFLAQLGLTEETR